AEPPGLALVDAGVPLPSPGRADCLRSGNPNPSPLGPASSSHWAWARWASATCYRTCGGCSGRRATQGAGGGYPADGWAPTGMTRTAAGAPSKLRAHYEFDVRFQGPPSPSLP